MNDKTKMATMCAKIRDKESNFNMIKYDDILDFSLKSKIALGTVNMRRNSDFLSDSYLTYKHMCEVF